MHKKVLFHVYTEGAGKPNQKNSKNLRIRLKKAFTLFIKRSIKQTYPGHTTGSDVNFVVIPCGSRDQAFKFFSRSWPLKKGDPIPLLLVDSEEPIHDDLEPWTFLTDREPWERPENATNHYVHLMVNCMENWFLADLGTLDNYFGPGFNTAALPKTLPIEKALKNDVMKGLKQASRNSRRGIYHKGRHSFDILEQIDPTKLQRKAPWACRFLKAMDDVLVHKKLNVSIRKCSLPNASDA
ncbi:MAG: DUF4276 family protein [Magnetococcales bacterium]|nr:DUF4276 family protein [Magnetococcales bacterium]